MTEATIEMERFHLVYDGPALQGHQMDVRALAPALLSVGNLVEQANEVLNGDRAKVYVNVNASFKTGCFGIDLDTTQSLMQKAIDLVSSNPVVSIGTICTILGLSARDGIKGVIAVVRWIRGRKITRIEPLSDGIVTLYINDEQLQVEERVLALIQDYKIRKALEGMIEEPLNHEGIESVSVMPRKGAEPVVHIEADEAAYFHAPAPEDEILDSLEYETNLQVANVPFHDGHKWRFTEGGGGNTFYADIMDFKFLERVQLNQERFAKDDILKARVRREQKMTVQGLKAEYSILEVLEHRNAAPKVQLGIDFDKQ
ncbi:hypothetical protein [Vreelandella hamiltonii]|uniref:Uncharacterized protein n=1 Tax=Vreelandella hamiltonii TaxID=502829 RepID=A0A8H9I2Q1_9GAMM|nr:hypothetical protein [Halomonas hamiltonii]GGW23670.1 hypothetical protein GCM10007157_13760 [Halomonas hamiltonii]